MYIKRKLEAKILKYLKSPEIIAIAGPRQCGKTTMLKKIYAELENAHFISFEDRAALNLFNKDIKGFIALHAANYNYLFIDEFQYAKNGGKKLKYIFDNHKIKILISGSSSVDLSVNAVKYLVGRIFIFGLYPLDFEEFLSFKDPNLKEIYARSAQHFLSSDFKSVSEPIHDSFKKHFCEFAVFGGYPRVAVSADEEEKKEVLKNIYNTFFLREVKDILGLIDDYHLEKLIKGLALQAGNMAEYKELGRLSEFSYPTLKRYLNFLEKTFICRRLRPYFKNKRTEIVKNPKMFFLDCGLRNQAVNDFRPLEERPDFGQLLENAVFCQLEKRGYDFNYWRDKAQHEMDFVLNLEGGKIAALEIKSKAKNTPGASATAFQKAYPEAQIILAHLNPANSAPSVRSDFLPRPVYLL